MSELLSSWFPGGSGLTAADFAVFGALLAAMTALGWRAGAATADEFLLGGRRIPWGAAALALVAAEVSALTVLGLPATAFRGDWTYLPFFAGAVAARVLVAAVFVPAFFRSGGVTVYGYLGTRFGPLTQSAAAGSFVASRLLLSAVRLLVAAVAAGALLGWGLTPTLALFTVVALAALARGGAPAAVWTGAFQAAVVLGAGALSALYLVHRVDGGLPAALSAAGAAGKLRFFSGSSAFGAALLTGFVGSAAAFGADQELAQKLLVVKDARAARGAMLLAIAGSFLVLLLHLSIGTLLFVFYKQNPGLALPDRPDRIFPYFAATAMPRVLRGLVLTSVVLASIDAPLASLSSALVADLRRPWARLAPTPERELASARRASVSGAFVLAGLAALLASSPAALSFSFKAGGVAAGPLLGVFALGLTTKRRGDLSAFSALTAAVAAGLLLLVLSETGRLAADWSALAGLGAAATYALGWALTRPAPGPAGVPAA